MVSAIIQKCTGIPKMYSNPENERESRKCTGIPKKLYEKKKNKKIFFGFFLFFFRFFCMTLMHGNTENLVIPNGNTEFPKFLYPENSGIPNSRKIPIPELQYSRRKKIREWPLPSRYQSQSEMD